MTIRRRRLIGSAALAALVPTSFPSRAQAWPARPLRIVHGYDAGTNPDTIARLFAPGLAERLGQPVLVEPRPGAAGRIAAKYVATYTGDEPTAIMLTAGDPVVAALDPKAPFRLPQDFAFVSAVIEFPFLFCVAADSPLKSPEDLLAAARRRPGQVSYGTPGVGTTQSMAGELLQTMAGVDLLHVPYKGNAFQDLLGGRVDFLVAAPSVSMSLIQSGKVRALAVTAREPHPQLPDVAPVSRAVPNYEVKSWLGLAVPKATPDAAVQRFAQAVQQVAGLEGVKEGIARAGSVAAAHGSEAFRQRVEADVRKWSALAGRVKLES